jgi:ATP-dependent DNA helicase RecG
MTALELNQLIAGGETTTLQLKENVTNAVSAAQEMVAFANSRGGYLVVGVSDKTGEAVGLSFQDLQRIQNLLSAAANDLVKSPIVISTEVVDLAGKKVLVATVPEGADKPHTDKDGLIFLKNGADKRKVTSREELARLLQSTGNRYADRSPLRGSSIKDLDWGLFKEFYEKKYKEEPLYEAFEQTAANLRLLEDGQITLTANLLFGKRPQSLSPDAHITAIWFAGNDLAGSRYLSSENIGSTLDRMFVNARSFVMSCLRKEQNGKDFNSLGDPEVPEIVINELLINALIHRDYFIHDSIKLLVFDNRIEIRSPGKLPNSLTLNDIKRGISRRRNHLLASFAFDVLPYRGIGSGVLRALQHYPDIDFIHDEEAEQFAAIIHRKPMAAG